jgi:hypothetical protein
MDEEQKTKTAEQETSEMSPKRNGNSFIGLLAVSAVVILLIIAGLYMLNQRETEQPYENMLVDPPFEMEEVEDLEDPEDSAEVENELEEPEPEEPEPLLEGEHEVQLGI